MTRVITVEGLPVDTFAPPVPVALPRLLLDLAARRGVDVEALMQRAGVSEDELRQDDGCVRTSAYASLVADVLTATDDACFGIEFGRHVTPTMFGFLGLALLSSRTLRDALHCACDYALIGSRFVSFDASEDAEGVLLSVRGRVPLGFAQQFVIESTLAAWLNCAALVGGASVREAHLKQARLQFGWERPADFDAYAQALPETRFNAEEHGLWLPHALLDQPVPMAHPATANAAKALCEEEMRHIRESGDMFLAVVSELMAPGQGGYPTLEDVAGRLSMSVRTLARRLDAVGASFSGMLEARRRRDAERLLGSSEILIEDISVRLGYENPGNFSRAFKRWTGMSPRAYREQLARTPG